MYPFRERVGSLLGGGEESREMFDKKEMRDNVDLKRRLDVGKGKIGGLFFWVQDSTGEKGCMNVRVDVDVLWKFFRECVCGM